MSIYFKRGAYLYAGIPELSEQEFIEKAGGIEELEKLKDYPFISLVLDVGPTRLVGHLYGASVAIVMQAYGHERYQTMEWKKR